MARERALITAIQNNALAIIDEQGGSPAQKFGAQIVSEGAELIGLGPEGVGRAAGVGAHLLTNMFDEGQVRATQMIFAASQAQVEAAQAMTDAAEKMGRAAERMERALGGGPALKRPEVDK